MVLAVLAAGCGGGDVEIGSIRQADTITVPAWSDATWNLIRFGLWNNGGIMINLSETRYLTVPDPASPSWEPEPDPTPNRRFPISQEDWIKLRFGICNTTYNIITAQVGTLYQLQAVEFNGQKYSVAVQY
jgi:hypothetical protein